jgi:TatD DNase family protein
LVKAALRLYDAHIHLTDREYTDYIGQIVTGLRAMNIVACSVTVDTDTALRSFSLFNQHRDVVKQFVGIHPEAAAKDDIGRFREIFRDNLKYIDGVGEIGLDGTYAEKGIAPLSRQNEVFRVMLELAESAGRPVSIHSRKALDDILEILPSYRLRGTLLHWFAGSKKQLARSTDMGLYVSYGPVLVYSEEKRVLLKNTPSDRFLVETDGPVRYARCFESLPAMSNSFLVSVVSAASSVLGLSYDETCELIEANTSAYLAVS